MSRFFRLLLFLIFLLVPAVVIAAEVKNVQLYQQGRDAVFSYDLVGAESNDEVKLTLTVGGKTCRQDTLHLTGDIGSVKPGGGKKIVWHVLQDFPRGVAGKMSWQLEGSGRQEAATFATQKPEVRRSAPQRQTYTDPTTGMEFVLVKGGCYQMSSNSGGGDEKLVHEVCVDDFYVGKYEVTQDQYQKIIGSNPSKFKGGNRPVEMVSWNDAQSYIQQLNQRRGDTRIAPYRLPTEAEWEYAARSGGKNETWAGTSSESSLGNYAWYSSNSEQTHPVGQKQANGLGLYDMTGNVWEWCQDWYRGNYYSQSPKNNPQGPSLGSDRVRRGGSWNLNASFARAAYRRRSDPDYRSSDLGFRLVLPTVQ